MTLSESYDITHNEKVSSVESCDCYEEDDIIPDELRDGRTEEELKWPNNTIPYHFIGNYTEDERNIVKSAMEEVMKETCIKFIERTTENSYVLIHVSYVK